MNPHSSSKLTIVSYPDFHLEPGATRILCIENYSVRERFQDCIGQLWPDEDVTVYMSSGKNQDEMDWLLYQAMIADQIVIGRTHWEWVWPIVMKSPADIFHLQEDDGYNFQNTIRSLKLTYPDRVFNSVYGAVQAMISARHK